MRTVPGKTNFSGGVGGPAVRGHSPLLDCAAPPWRPGVASHGHKRNVFSTKLVDILRGGRQSIAACEHAGGGAPLPPLLAWIAASRCRPRPALHIGSSLAAGGGFAGKHYPAD